MYSRIVVGTDGSGRAGQAVEHAAELARLSGAELHLVQGIGSPVLNGGMHGEVVAVNPGEILESCRLALEPLVTELSAAGLAVKLDVRAESGHVALCNVAEELGADLIVVGNRGMTGSRRFLGSVPNSVTHQAPCSVLIVGTD